MSELTAVSLFAGVEGIGLALERAGVTVTAAVEIDDAARGVIVDRMPDTTLFTDVTKVTADELRATGFVPDRGIIAAGWPCQGNSVAGGRGGMADPRSGLWRHVVRLLAETRARWFLGENVPGLLSVNDGDDFGVVVHDLGALGYGGASRVLDAQFFGVPQRRRRVFFVGCLGDQRRPVQVLAEPEGGVGDPPPSRAPGQGVAATLTRGSNGAGVSAPGRRQEDDVNLIVSPTLTARYGKGTDSDATDTMVVSTLQGGGKRGHRIDAESAAGGHLIVAPTLTASMGSNAGHPGDAGKDDMVLAVAETLRSHPRPGSNSNGALVVSATGDTAHTLTSEGHDASEDGTGRGTPVVAFHMTQDPISSTDIVPAMGAKSGGNGLLTETVVRRLTPRECERLQGFPDDWTLTSNGKPQADSARYRQMGNAVAVPCVEWIARRIVAVA